MDKPVSLSLTHFYCFVSKEEPFMRCIHFFQDGQFSFDHVRYHLRPASDDVFSHEVEEIGPGKDKTKFTILILSATLE